MNGGKPKNGLMRLWADYSIGRPCHSYSSHSFTHLSPRFGNPSQLPSTLKSTYSNFAKNFVSAFAPEIFNAYLHQVELYVSSQEWLSSKCQYQIFQFFTEWCVLVPLLHSSLSFSVLTLLDYVSVLNRNPPGFSSKFISSL